MNSGLSVIAAEHRLIHREGEEERRPFVYAAFHPRGAVVGRHQVLDDGKPQTGAAQLPRAGLVHAIEPFEQARQVFRRECPIPVSRTKNSTNSAVAGVPPTVIVPPGGVYLMALSSRLLRICETASLSHQTSASSGARFVPQLDAALFRDRPHQVDRVAQQRVHEVRFEFEFLPLLLDAGKRQQIRGQARQTLRVVADDARKRML